MRKLFPFIVSKSLDVGIGKDCKASKMTSRDLLIELTNTVQQEKLYDFVTIGNTKITITEHRSLNTCSGIISQDDFLSFSDGELLKGFQDQNVVEVQCITFRRNNEQLQLSRSFSLLETVISSAH